MVKPDVQSEMQESAGKELDREEFQQKLMEKAQASANWGNFAAAVGAFSAGLDVGIAYGAAHNATEHNFLQAALVIASLAGTAYEGYQIFKTYKKEGGEAAMKHLGISVVEGAVVAGVAGVAFKVGKAVYPTLKEAFKAAVANNLILKTSLTTLETKLGAIEQAIRTKFNTGGIDAFKSAPKAEKSVKFADNSKPHGNSLEYTGDTHVYVIRDASGKIHKVGESMQGTNALGQSKRAESQARKLYKTTEKKYETEIRREFSTKAEARVWETELIERYRSLHGKDLLPGNKGNR